MHVMSNIAQQKGLFLVGCLFLFFSKVSSTCTDNIQNQDETDIDCGGSHCANRCTINQKCIGDSDCNSATCVAGICSGRNAKVLKVCKLIAKEISSASQVFYPPSSGYRKTIKHYAPSSTIHSVCGVEPGSAADVAIILKIIGQYRVPFAVKGGGHATNPGFSSTTGVQISMNRFQKVTYNSNKETVDIGSGLVWDNVYKALGPYNVTVVGGRIATVGVAGYLLGGGYSWKSNRYALGIDNMLEYELVIPNGTIVHVNSQSYPDLFFGLKGGYNNFGIVTSFNMRALSQTEVYGGILIYDPPQFDAVIEAMIDFHANNKDSKAVMTGTVLYEPGLFKFVMLAFYDAPMAPKQTFAKFLSIPHIFTLQKQSYHSLIKLVTAYIPVNLRTRYDVVSVTNISTQLLNGIVNLFKSLIKKLGSKRGAFFVCDIEPYISSYLDNSKGGAYPHPASRTPLFPIHLEFSWQSSSDDALFVNATKSTQKAILNMALAEGQKVGGSKQIRYPNYAIASTPLKHLYGNNVARLRRIRKALDPKNVMLLAGGFKF